MKPETINITSCGSCPFAWGQMDCTLMEFKAMGSEDSYIEDANIVHPKCPLREASLTLLLSQDAILKKDVAQTEQKEEEPDFRAIETED